MKWHKGDCHVRCVAKALDISWKDAIKLEYEKALERCDSVGSTNNIEAVLLDNGFKKGVINQSWIRRNHRRPTFKEILNVEHYKDKIVVGRMTHHVATAVNQTVYDTWDCSNQVLWSFWYK
jgi:hypothetical protein